jgi:hypothetical protein
MIGCVVAVTNAGGSAIAINSYDGVEDEREADNMAFRHRPISGGSNIVCPSHAGGMAK